MFSKYSSTCFIEIKLLYEVDVLFEYLTKLNPFFCLSKIIERIDYGFTDKIFLKIRF